MDAQIWAHRLAMDEYQAVHKKPIQVLVECVEDSTTVSSRHVHDSPEETAEDSEAFDDSGEEDDEEDDNGEDDNEEDDDEEYGGADHGLATIDEGNE